MGGRTYEAAVADRAEELLGADGVRWDVSPDGLWRVLGFLAAGLPAWVFVARSLRT